MASSDSEEEIFEVDYIMEQRGRGKNVEYFIRWKGFGEEEDSWEPHANIAANASESIAEFKRRQGASKTPGKTPKRLVKHEGSGDTESSTVQKSTKKFTMASGATKTVTTTSTKTVTKSQTKAALSDLSSPESSPVMTRRAYQSQTTKRTHSSAASGFKRCLAGVCALPCRALSFFKLSRQDLPILILVTCLLVVASSFYIVDK